MIHRFNQAVFSSARQLVSHSGSYAIVVRDSISGLLTTAHHTLLFFGFCAITTIGLMLVKPSFTDQLRESLSLKTMQPTSSINSINSINSIDNLNSTNEGSAPLAQQTAMMDTPTQPFAPVSTSATPAAFGNHKAPVLNKSAKTAGGTQRQQQWVTDWLSKRYRVAGDAATVLVATSYLTAQEIQLDPLLILAVMAIESGLNPIAESPMGAQGLMQVMSKIHQQKFQPLGGIKEALNPVANIKVGALILKDYVTRGGSVEAGLKSYVGAAAFDNDAGYGSRVMAEYQRLKDVATGKNVPTLMTINAPSAQKLRTAERTEEAKDTGTEPVTPASHDQVRSPRRGSDQMAAL